TKASAFSCDNDSTLGKFTSGYSSDSKMTSRNGWDCIGAYAKALLNPSLNPAGVSIKTAVVGFGNDFSKKTSSDEKDADKWGVLGGGGSYVGNNDQAVVDSVLAFLKKLQKYIPPVTTGSVTIPVDNLDTQNIQPWGYFPQFDPQPSSTAVTWVGNVKKYKNEAGTLQDRDGKAIMTDEGISVDDPYDYWATNLKKEIIKRVDGEDKRVSVRIGGVLSNIKVERTATEFVERKVFTDRQKITVKDNQSLA